MPMKPGKDESQSEFMSRCVPEMIGAGPDKRPQDQAVAICMDIWREEHPDDAYHGRRTTMRRQTRQAPSPEAGESHDDFIDRCTAELEADGLDETEAEAACEVEWDERKAPAPVVKTTAAKVRDFVFTLSDETTDRYGDIVSADGWDLDWFRKNPVALFGHNHDFPIGRWTNVHVDKKSKALRGTLDIPKGVSQRIDEVGRLVDGGYLNAVSVGFRPRKYEYLKDDKGEETGGVRFTHQELLECSVVPVPANPNALIQARALNISPETIRMVFAEPGNRNQPVLRRDLTGEFAAIPLRTRHKPMPSTTISQRIQDTEHAINEERDAQENDIRDSDDENPDDAVTQRINVRATRIGLLERRRDALMAAEATSVPGARHDGSREDPPGNGRGRDLVPVYTPNRIRSDVLQASASEIAIRRADNSIKWRAPPAIIKHKKELDPVDYLVRNGVVMLLAHKTRKSPEEVLARVYGDDENTKAVFNAIQRAASAPAMTDVDGWAAQLVEQIYADFMYPLMPMSIFPRLAARGMSLQFGRSGRINMPTRSRTTTIAGSFVGEGQPIPVRQALFASQFITPKKLGVITVMTREIEEHSTPAIEALLRQAISEDTGESIDSILLDQNPADVVRPPGIRNNIPNLTGSTAAAEPGGPFYMMVRDIRRLRAALIGPTNDNVRAPCWLMNPIRADAIALNPAPGTGLFPFRDNIRAGNLEGWPVFESTTIAPDQIIVIDAADFVTAGQGAPMFEVSDQATLHMEDTEPGPIHGVPPGAQPPPVAATPVRSLWQTDSFALRLLYRVNWMLRRPMVAWMNTFGWGGILPNLPGVLDNGEGERAA
jgi:HK97 family phage prohead protease